MTAALRIGVQLTHGIDPLEVAAEGVRYEEAGADIVWISEVYGVDAISTAGFLAAQTKRVQIGTAIIPVYSRTPALLGMTAVGIDALSRGRFILGLGTSGPQVVSGWHGVPFDTPLAHLREAVSVCHSVWERKPLEHEGTAYSIPWQHGETEPFRSLKLVNRPFRSEIPIFVAGLGQRNVALAAEVAEGWLTVFFWPEKAAGVWSQALLNGQMRRDRAMSPLQISAGGRLAIGEGLEDLRDEGRVELAMYIGAMGTKNHNFYNDLLASYGYPNEAKQIQEFYARGDRDAAAAAVPQELVDGTSLVGPEDWICRRLEAYREAGVTILSVTPVGPSGPESVERLRRLIDA